MSFDTAAVDESRGRRRGTLAFEKARQRAVQNAKDSAEVSEAELEEWVRAAEMQRQLIKLEAAFYDDYERELDPESKAGLASFLKRFGAAFPLLGAESTGQLIATWTRGKECLSLRFLDLFRFHYSLVTEVDGQLKRQWNTAHALTFLDEHPEAKRLIAS